MAAPISVQDNVKEMKTALTVGERKDTIEDVANRFGRTIRSAVEHGTREVAEAADTATTTIRARPVQSSLIALGLGFLVGGLFRR